MASCDITILFASLLDVETDRLAIISTMPTNAEQGTCNPVTLAPLDRVNKRKLKVILDSIASSTVQPGTTVVIEAVKQAQEILLKSERLCVLDKPTNETFGHVVVLTADVKGLCGEILDSSSLQTHILCTGIPKERIWDEVECNGWKMCVMSPFLARNRPHHSRSKRDMDPQSFDNRIHALIQHARSGQLADVLTDVVLDINCGSGSRKEKTMGWSSFSKLRIGEVKTVLVSLCHESNVTEPTFLNGPDSCESSAPSNGENLMEAIDRMLGLSEDRVLKAKLRYKHSSLPINTTCTTTTKCLLNLQFPTSKGKTLIRRPVPSKSTNLLHQRLAEYYAAYYKPRDALLALQQEFGEGGCHSTCPIYINALADELKYQARISERMAIENSPQKSIALSRAPRLGPAVDYPRRSSSSRRQYRPYNETKALTDKALKPDGSQVHLVEQLGLDDAWKIWHDIRHMARGEKVENRSVSTPTSAMMKKRAKRFSETIMKEEKNMGGSTMRNFSSPLERSRNGGHLVVDPWL